MSSQTHDFYTLKKVSTVLEELNEQGYSVIDKFHNEEKALAILDEVKNIHAKGKMHKGRLASTLSSQNIRGDFVMWVNGNVKGAENIALHMRRTDALLRQLNKIISYHRIEGRTKV